MEINIVKIVDALMNNDVAYVAKIQSAATPAQMTAIMSGVKVEMKNRQDAIAAREAKKLGY